MGQLRRKIVATGAVLSAGIAGVALAGPATAAKAPAQAAQEEGVRGDFSAVMMIHTSSSSFGNLPDVNPWGGERRTRDTFRYRSIPCTGNAPVNNISSDLPSYNTRVAGSRAPSSMRAHPFRFRVRKNADGEWEMSGGITFTVCKLAGGPTPANDPIPDPNKPKIRVRFRSTFTKMTNESLHFAGRFRLTGGTQRYEDLTGSGEIAGYFMCFNPQGCAALGGKYLDGQFVMHGQYRDPTPNLAAP
jgi:hypothetical protein